MEETIQIDVVSSNEDYGMRFAYLPKAMSDAYMKETAGIIVEERTEFQRLPIFQYVNTLLLACEVRARNGGYKSMVCILHKETYDRLLPFFGKDSNVHSEPGIIWQFIPEIHQPRYVTYLIHPPNTLTGGCTVWPMHQTQMKLKFA